MSVQRLAVVVNPRSGTQRGLEVLKRVKPVLAPSGSELDVRVTQYPGHAGEIAKSLHEVADGLMQRGEPISIPLGIIPAGTGNTLHQHLQCDNPLEAARRIAMGRTQPLDVVQVAMKDRVFFCVHIVGWGAVADINCTAERLRMLGSPRYAVSALWHILWPRHRRAKLILDGRTVEDDFLFVIACNAKFTGSGMKLAPHAEIGDGKIDVVVVCRASRRQMLKLFTKVFDGSQLSLGYVQYHQVSSFAIEAEIREPLDLDGEMKGNTPLSAIVLPAALRIFT